MYNNFYGMQNGFQQMNQQYQHYEIIHVNGENGARAFQMGANSNALLLDDSAPIIWLATTDGAGYKSLQPYSISPYQPEQPIDVKSLENRISKLEAMLNESNNTNSKQGQEPSNNSSKR